MSSVRTRLGARTGVLALVAGVAMGMGVALSLRTQPSATAVPQAAGLAPTRVALVDMMVLINGLDELKDRNKITEGVVAEYRKQVEAMENNIKLLEGELKDNITPDQTQLRIEKATELQVAKNTLKLQQERMVTLFDLRNAQNIRELYIKAQDAIKRLASQEAYDLVLLDDRPVPLTSNTGQQTLNDEILKKRILFANDNTINVTQRVLTIMQNEYAAGKSK